MSPDWRDEDNLPERIWAGDFNASGFGHCVVGPQGGLYAEYVRADLAAPAGEPVGIKPYTPTPWDAMEDPRGRLIHIETSIDNPAGAGLPVCSIPVKRKADALFIVAAANALHPSPTPVSAPVGVDVEAAAVAGWNACRKSVYAVCEDVIDKAVIALERVNKADETAQHEKGFYRGERSVAKSIARGFNAMEALDDNYLRDALAALRSPAVEGK